MGRGRRGGRERKGEKTRDDRSGKPGGEIGSEERVCGVQRGRLCLETTMRELPPVGERGGIDLGQEMRFFDWGDKVRDVIH